jgi:hypothetical protein
MSSRYHLYSNKPALAATLKLRADQRVLFGQTVGYPANE